MAAPPTTDHGLVRESVDVLGGFQVYGGTAIGDAIAAAVELGEQTVGPSRPGAQTIAYTAAPAQREGLVSILFLSDGAQTRGVLQPWEGAERAKEAGYPVYTIALGTPNGVLRLDGRWRGGFGFGPPGSQGPPGGQPTPGNPFGRREIPVPPDPDTLRAIAETTGGEFSEARTAEALEVAYEKLGSSLGREPGETEVTFAFVGAAAALLLAAGILSALWSPRLP